MVWIFCRHDLFQVTGTDVRCILYIMNVISLYLLSKSSSILPVVPGLLHHLILFCFTLALLYFWLTLIVWFTSAISLICTDLCKVSNKAVFLTHVGIRQMPTWLPTWKAKSLYHVSTFLPMWFFLPLHKSSKLSK